MQRNLNGVPRNGGGGVSQEMKEENFASVTSIERVWFVDSDEAVYSKAPYTHCLSRSHNCELRDL